MSLAGRRVLVTRAVDDAEAWAESLVRLGAYPVIFPCLVSASLNDAATAARLRLALSDADWLVLSSRRGVESAASLVGPVLPPCVRIATVGPTTAQAAMVAWGHADLVAVTPTSEGLATELADAMRASPQRAVVAGAVDGRRDAGVVLASRGWRVTIVPVYRTIAAPASRGRIDLSAQGVDDILLASPSAVTGLLNQAVLPSSVRIITIGPTTTAAARAAGLDVAAEALWPGLDGMLEAMQ